MPSGVKATLMPERREQAADPAVGGVERGQRDAGDRGGQRERQVDRGVEQALAGKLVAHQHPGHEQAEHGVDQRRGGRGAEAEPAAPPARAASVATRQNARRGRASPARAISTASGISTISDEVDDGEAEREAEAGHHARLRTRGASR